MKALELKAESIISNNLGAMKKNIFRVLLAVGAIATVFAGCRKSELQQAQEPIKVTLHADRPDVQDETKTQLDGTAVLWSVDDQIGVTDNAGKNATNNAFTNDATVASATTSFTGETAVSGQLYAYYPYSTEVVNTNGAKPTIKTVQKPSSNASFDGSCDILVSKPFSVSPEGTQLSDLVFRRLTAVLKIVIKGEGLPSGEEISSITVESSETDLTGKVNVSFDKFDLDGFTSATNSAKSVTVNAATPFAVDGTTGLLACVYPGKFAAGSKLTISGTTSNCTFKKEIDITSDLVFERGKITTLNVAIGTANVTPSASFIFNSDAGLASLGIDKPNTGAGTNLGNNRYKVGPISMIATNGGTATRVYNSEGNTDLRVYNGGSLSFSGATITKIQLTGENLDKLSPISGTYENGTWTGSAESVKFTASGTANINTIVVTYTAGTTYCEYTVSCAPADGGTLSASSTLAKAGTEITLTATPDDEYVFNNDWSVNDASENPVTVSNGKFTMPASDVTVSASFAKKTYTIDMVSPENGTFEVKVNGVTAHTASKGDQITLEATPVGGYEFGMWNVINKENSNPITVTDNKFKMPGANIQIGATFITPDSVPVFASLADLVDAGAPVNTGSLVTVTLTDQKITKLNKSGNNINGVYFMVGAQEVEIYCTNAPSDWKEGGSISGTLTKCIWQLYGTTWELCPTAWTGLTYKAPCATPTITFTGNKATIECTTDGATIKYGISDDDTQPEINTPYTEAVELTDGQTIWAQATKDGMMPSDIASKKYSAGTSTGTSVTYTQSSATAASVNKGTAPEGSTVSFNNTYGSNKQQLTSGNTMTLTLNGYTGKKITGITLSMHSNKSSGAGYLSVTAGTTSLASIGTSSSGVDFNDPKWYGDWSKDVFVDVEVDITDKTHIIGSDESVTIVIGATINSLYCQSFTITYE